MTPKISIIIPVFNGAKSIDKAIESVLTQTYQNFELLIIDGGSTDETIKILKNCNSNKVTWTSEPDNGIYDAMNKGIQKAKGDWLFFLGDDDHFYNENVLNSIFLNSHFENIDFLYGNVKSDYYKQLYDGQFNYEKLLKKNISHQAIFYRKSIFSKVGIYNLKYKTHADWDFNLRCFENVEVRIQYVNSIVAKFGKGGVSSNYDIPYLNESLLPRKLGFIKSNKKVLRNIKEYDEWWRFIRNSGVRNNSNIKGLGHDFEIPDVILSMVKWQNKLPQNLLRNGVFSKIIMFANYIANINKIHK